MRICAESVDSLTSFQFSNAAKTESEKFGELYLKWNEVFADLEEIGKTSVLNHEPTLFKVLKNFPSRTLQNCYIDRGFVGCPIKKIWKLLIWPSKFC